MQPVHVHRKENLYKAPQRMKRVRSNGRGSSPFGSFNPLSVVWKNSDDEGAPREPEGETAAETLFVHPPTHPPCLLPDEPGGGVGWTHDVTARDWRHHLFDVTAEHRPLQVVAGWLAIRDVIAVRSAEENFCSNGARRFHVKFLVKWIMDFVEAEIIVSCTCLNDEGKGLGIRLLD